MEHGEVNFDAIVGPTHNFAGLSPGNIASQESERSTSHPRAAALEGLAKMARVAGLGVLSGVFPPAIRPHLGALRSLGFTGSDEAVLVKAAIASPKLVALTSSASSMWAANAATVAPSSDTEDGRVHLVPANLTTMFHRSIEASQTTAMLRAIFADDAHFVVHDPLPAADTFADEGAANHTRLASERGVVHLFAWGRSAWDKGLASPSRFPARQTREASEAVARLLHLKEGLAEFAQQSPFGIDQGAFHTDVVAVGNGGFFMLHEHAFLDRDAVLSSLRRRLGEGFTASIATEAELPVSVAVGAYPFNSQVVSVSDGMTIVAPTDAENTPLARAFLERVVREENPVNSIVYVDVRQSMRNGGGPACLRLRVPLSALERAKMRGRVLLDEPLRLLLEAWIKRHYREDLTPADLRDPTLYRESMEALDALTQILQLGSLYEFQR